MTTAVSTDQVRRAWSKVLPQWRAGWEALSKPLRWLWVAVVAISVFGTLVMTGQIGSDRFIYEVSVWTYVVVPVAAGALLVAAGWRQRDRGRAAWTLIGVGVALWGLGEVIWVSYSYLRNAEIPYPGWADVFYVVAYPIIFAGVLLLPHVRARKWERARLSLDALAGTVALSALVWTFYLRDAIYIDSEAGLLENFVNLAYPAGDLILLIAFMILATRRSNLQFDGRILIVALGMLITAVADMAYVFQIEAETYVEGGRLDATWLAAYGLFALAALLVAGPPRLREQADRPGRLWPLIAPYTAIAVLFAVTLGELGGQATILQIATAAVGILIIARQGVAIRETREVVEKQRNDLVASISHELRTPLTSMAGFTELLADNPDLDEADRIEMIGIVNTQTKHLTRIVGDLVEVARDILETAPLIRTEIRVDELIQSAIGMLTNGAASAHITTHVEDGLVVSGDVDRLRQVVVNYLTNAGRYGKGQVEVHARRSGNNKLIIEVHDNGPGIPKKHEVTIWDRFERGAHTYLSEVHGSGLGLAIARQLITAHRGETGQHPSERLPGACFWLTLPTVNAATDVSATHQSASVR